MANSTSACPRLAVAGTEVLHHWAPTMTVVLAPCRCRRVRFWVTADSVLAAAAGVVVTAPLKPAAGHRVLAWRTVLFVPSAVGVRVSTRFGTTCWPPLHVSPSSRSRSAAVPATMIAFVAFAVADEGVCLRRAERPWEDAHEEAPAARSPPASSAPVHDAGSDRGAGLGDRHGEVVGVTALVDDLEVEPAGRVLDLGRRPRRCSA